MTIVQSRHRPTPSPLKYLLALGALALGPSCASKSDEPSVRDPGTATENETSPRDDERNECADFELTAASVPQTGSSTEPPPAKGGTILDGTYDVTSYLRHGVETASPLASFRQTFVFSESGTKAALVRERADGEILRAELSLRTDGTKLHMMATCPSEMAGQEEVMEFTATSTTFVAHLVQGTVHATVTYTKR